MKEVLNANTRKLDKIKNFDDSFIFYFLVNKNLNVGWGNIGEFWKSSIPVMHLKLCQLKHEFFIVAEAVFPGQHFR